MNFRRWPGILSRRTTGYFLIAVLTGVLGFVWGEMEQTPRGIASPLCAERYELLNPSVICNLTDEGIDRVHDAEDKTKLLIQKSIASGRISKGSVFYRNLETKSWFAIKDTENFWPGSLLKVPLAVAYFKLSEVDPNVFTQTFEYKGGLAANSREYYQPKESIKAGERYSIEELISRMIIDSDNEAANFLAKFINKDFLDKVFLDLGIYFPTSDRIEEKFVSVRNYSNMLRTIFNASYLNADNSEKLLEIMTKSRFADGLRAGVPDEAKVAHKFGERTIAKDPDIIIGRGLNDCGVVYKKGGAYSLCVMVEGEDFEKLAGVIKDVSRLVYEVSS